MRFDGILFDLDGTLWDARASILECWNIVISTQFPDLNRLTAADVRKAMGMTRLELAEHLFPGTGSRGIAATDICLKDECGYIKEHGALIFPGVREMLERLSKKAKLFIVSNCGNGYIESFLEYSGCGKYFSDYLCEGSTGLTKAGNIVLLTDRWGLESPVYVGDTRSDEISAANAGCPFIHAAYGFGLTEAPLGRINSVSELEAMLETI